MSTTLDGKGSLVPISPICINCKHFDPNINEIRHCAAFDQIPVEIWVGENDHTGAYPNDRGIRFEPRP